MSHNYRNPPLVEALCEFQFKSDSWDWTLPGLLYTNIKGKFPIKKQIKKIGIEIKPDSAQIDHNVLEDVNRIQFFNHEQSALIQAGPNLLAVNNLKPYIDWHTFRSMIIETLLIYNELAKPSGIKRIGLRFINRIEIPETQFELEKFFNISPKIPDKIPHNFNSVFLRVEIPYHLDNSLLVLSFGSIADNNLSKAKDNSAFILDLDFSTTHFDYSSMDDCESWIEKAHSHIETAFEACLTDQLRDYFE